MSGITGHIGLGQESTPGTGVAPDIFFPGTENIKVNIPQLRDENPYGGYDELGSSPGNLDIRGQISCQAYPTVLGHLLYALLGSDTEGNGSAPYEHTFKRAAAVSSVWARPAYSFQVTKDGQTTRYTGGQCTQIGLSQDNGGRLAVTSDWIFQNYDTGQSAATPTLPSVDPLRFKHTAHTLGGSAFNLIESMNLTMSNGIEAEFLQDGSDLVSAFHLGRSILNGSMTFAFRDTAQSVDFYEQSQNAWEYVWEISSNYGLTINIPKLKLEDYDPPLSGAGRLTKTTAFRAERDATLGASFSAVLVHNDVADFSA